MVAGGASVLTADTVETRDGARLVGKITGITEEKITMVTAYAGTLEINKTEVVGFSTDDPVFVRLGNGMTISGKVSHSGQSKLKIVGLGGELATEMPKIAASWGTEEEDPNIVKRREEIEALRRKWGYEVGVDLTGKSGNSDESGMATRIKADLAGPNDSLGLYLSIDKAKNKGNQTSNEVIAGATYNSFFKEKLGWFVRSELESDEFEDIDFRVTTAGGLSYRFFKEEHHALSGRAGFSYRFESLDNGSTIKAPGLDFGLNHFYRIKKVGRVTTDIKFIPSVKDFSDFRLTQDTGFEFPLGGSGFFKLRLGISNFFNNNPAPGKVGLDTTYYTRLLFTWD